MLGPLQSWDRAAAGAGSRVSIVADEHAVEHCLAKGCILAAKCLRFVNWAAAGIRRHTQVLGQRSETTRRLACNFDASDSIVPRHGLTYSYKSFRVTWRPGKRFCLLG